MQSAQVPIIAIWHWPFTKHGRRRIVFCVGALILGSIVAYAIAYLSVMQVSEMGIIRGVMVAEITPAPIYDCPDFFPLTLWIKHADTFFEPAHRVDRLLRPSVWKRRSKKIDIDSLVRLPEQIDEDLLNELQKLRDSR